MSSPGQTPSVVRGISDRVDAKLCELLDAERTRWGELDPDLDLLLDALSRFVLRAGKRIRPAFCYWAFVGAGGDGSGHVIDTVGAAYELLHGFALVHDDVMDDAAIRRGSTTVHVEFETLHRDSGWRGEPRRFGEGVAILAGDLAHVYADRLLSDVPPAARQVWDELRIELNIGQYLDIVGTARGLTDAAAARRIARYKSARYTIERPLHLGAALAGRIDDLAEPLSAYGAPLGEAFQLRDDLLGVFGEAAVTGKPVGDDLREGKPTPLIAFAVERADRAQREVLAGLGSAHLDPAGVREIQQVLVATGARAHVEATIDELVGDALAGLAAAPLADPARAALADLASYVAYRDR